MSRRKPPPRRPKRLMPGEQSVRIVCSESKHGPHGTYRIARVRVYPNTDPDAVADLQYIVRVAYVHGEDHGEDWADPVRTTPAPHMTRTFTCKCGRYVPLKDEKLAQIVRGFAATSIDTVDLRMLAAAASLTK